MYTPPYYGKRKRYGRFVPLIPNDTTGNRPPLPGKEVSARSLRCIGCSYPRSGLTCHSRDGTCLRTDMQALEAKWQAQRESKVEPI